MAKNCAAFLVLGNVLSPHPGLLPWGEGVYISSCNVNLLAA